MGDHRPRYGMLVHDRHTEADPPTASVIVSYDGGDTWGVMATGNCDYIGELLDALWFRSGDET